MRLARRTYALAHLVQPLTLALVGVVALTALSPIPLAFAGRSVLRPDSITPFPHVTAHQLGIAGQPTAAADPQKVGTASTLGKPIAASVELAPGNRIGYVFNSAGKQIASRAVTLRAKEADSATRRFRKSGVTYYLLS